MFGSRSLQKMCWESERWLTGECWPTNPNLWLPKFLKKISQPLIRNYDQKQWKESHTLTSLTLRTLISSGSKLKLFHQNASTGQQKVCASTHIISSLYPFHEEKKQKIITADGQMKSKSSSTCASSCVWTFCERWTRENRETSGILSTPFSF